MANTNNKTAAEAVKAVAQPAAEGIQGPNGQNSADEVGALKSRVDELSLALVNANRDKAGLQEQLDAARGENGELAGQLNDLQSELSESQELIDDLQDRLSRAATIQAQSDSVIVSDGTDHYKVLAPKFKHRKVEYTAEQLRDDEALVQELVAAGVGFLHKIETEK
jgi:chromosome segregation ATPase